MQELFTLLAAWAVAHPVTAAGLFLYAMYILFYVYSAAKANWGRMLIGHKALVSFVIVPFGILDVRVLQGILGTLVFLELPYKQTGVWWYQRQWTFSQHCADRYADSWWARAFAVLLNAVDKDHVMPTTRLSN